MAKGRSRKLLNKAGNKDSERHCRRDDIPRDSCIGRWQAKHPEQRRLLCHCEREWARQILPRVRTQNCPNATQTGRLRQRGSWIYSSYYRHCKYINHLETRCIISAVSQFALLDDIDKSLLNESLYSIIADILLKIRDDHRVNHLR